MCDFVNVQYLVDTVPIYKENKQTQIVTNEKLNCTALWLKQGPAL